MAGIRRRSYQRQSSIAAANCSGISITRLLYLCSDARHPCEGAWARSAGGCTAPREVDRQTGHSWTASARRDTQSSTGRTAGPSRALAAMQPSDFLVSGAWTAAVLDSRGEAEVLRVYPHGASTYSRSLRLGKALPNTTPAPFTVRAPHGHVSPPLQSSTAPRPLDSLFSRCTPLHCRPSGSPNVSGWRCLSTAVPRSRPHGSPAPVPGPLAQNHERCIATN